jgi:hypothetical protein
MYVHTPVLAKHSKSFSLIDCISVGVDRMQRNFEPKRKQVEAWQRNELTDVTAKVVIDEAFVEAELEAPKHLSRNVHHLYFEPRMRSSDHARSGVLRTHSPRPSRHSTRFPNLGRQPSWLSFWRLGSHSRSDLTAFGQASAPLVQNRRSNAITCCAGTSSFEMRSLLASARALGTQKPF